MLKLSSFKRIFAKFMLNIFPPYLGTGIRMTYLAPDLHEIEVQMKMHWYNRNYVKTHFGGSLYAMTDPFFMLMLIHILGKEYIVWDKAAQIEFIKPGRGTLSAQFKLTDQQIEDIRNRTSAGEKYLPEYKVDIIDSAGTVVASVIKTLYIRRKNGK